jgi:hypothetical protein
MTHKLLELRAWVQCERCSHTRRPEQGECHFCGDTSSRLMSVREMQMVTARKWAEQICNSFEPRMIAALKEKGSAKVLLKAINEHDWDTIKCGPRPSSEEVVYEIENILIYED